MIYVMSDIHGNSRRFHSVMEKIRLQPADTLYVLGDVIDRHPDGIRILRKIMAMPNAKMLLGNHEHMMLRALEQSYNEDDAAFPYDTQRWLATWYRNGGAVTHRHIKHLTKALRAEIFDYLRSLPLEYTVALGKRKYTLVHAAPPELYREDGQFYNPTHFAVWKRWQEEPIPGDRTLIFGHTPTRHYQPGCPMEIFYGPNRIGIDCGSGYPEDPAYEYYACGRLACLRLDDLQVFYSDP
jgi:serine/threonine protein phosphatase 1